jgi:hypothetical protein
MAEKDSNTKDKETGLDKGAEAPKFTQILDEKREQAVVSGLRSLKALGDALVCISAAKDSTSLDDDTLSALGSLIFEQADKVFEILKDAVI